MIHIITGEDIVNSRKKLDELLKESSNTVRIDGKKGTVSEFEISLVSDSMFDDKKIIVVEQFSKLKPQDKFIEILTRVQDDDFTLILWDEVDLSAKFKSLKSAKTSSFTFPKVYFQFMDSLTPASSASNVKALRDVLKSFEPEQILYSIIKRLRQLLVLKSANYSDFSEFGRMQDWQIGRLKSQANKWTEAELKKAFLEYGSLDEKVKTSGLTMDLSKHLDILLLSDLN